MAAALKMMAGMARPLFHAFRGGELANREFDLDGTWEIKKETRNIFAVISVPLYRCTFQDPILFLRMAEPSLPRQPIIMWK